MHATRRATRRLLGCCLLGALVLGARDAQSQVANDGALDLLVPIGARSTAMGTAFVAEEGSETIWWNPAGIARMTRPEFAIDHLENFILKGDAISVIAPVKRLGAFGLTARLFNYCTDCQGADPSGNPTSTLYYRSNVIGASFATTFGSRLAAGVTYRLYQLRSDCSGFCELTPLGTSTTSAVDVGVQIRPFPKRPLRVGIALRNAGLSLQVKDKPQADALPTRVHLGMSYDPTFVQLASEVKLSATAELVSSVGFENPELHMGAQVGYVAGPSVLIIRGGYVAQQSSGGESATGPSLGLGLASGRVQLDLARIFESFSSGLGKPPTYISIRIRL
ncbi:MAG: hypothetical protein ABIP93_02810 [Gemmatimonadaceae bacterium]